MTDLCPTEEECKREWPCNEKEDCIHFAATPARGEPMPQTREYWEKRAEMDQELIIKQKDEISALKQTVNNLRQNG